MGLLFLVSLPAIGDVIYRCEHCDTHLAYATGIMSKLFRCKHGKAYLFDNIVNVNVGEKDDRMMTTGMHTVCDIFCVGCGSILGWKYVCCGQDSINSISCLFKFFTGVFPPSFTRATPLARTLGLPLRPVLRLAPSLAGLRRTGRPGLGRRRIRPSQRRSPSDLSSPSRAQPELPNAKSHTSCLAYSMSMLILA